MTTSSTSRRHRRRADRAVHPLTSVLVAALVVTAAGVGTPASAAQDRADYRQVVSLTFPFSADVSVQYRDDYDDSRGNGRMHQSTDLMVADGTPVHAVLGGTVAWMSGDQSGPPSYGWMVRIAGDDGRTYAYVHLGHQDGPRDAAYAPGIEPGARVERGQHLGWAGCSGSASCDGGEHLHLEIHDPGVDDPYDYHDHERINPYPSLVAAERRGDYPVTGAFRDVDADSPHRDDVRRLALSGVTKGCGTGRFCPGDAVTREQMASFLVRALSLPPAEADALFADVTTTNVHAADIAALAHAGVTRGCGGDRFCPGDAVTREQMASFLVRALSLPPAPGAAFSDVLANNPHAADIAALADAGITKGCGGDRFCPGDAVTREQMASFLVRALGL